jgi:hypothetical protein
MAIVIDATFDGEVFRPTQPVELQPNTPVRLTFEANSSQENAQPPGPVMGKPYSFFELARSMKLEGPPDWSANVDKYLYGEELHGEDAGREE